jgi:arylsulfatase A-like enzyme
MSQKTNIVLIMADDLGYECLGCYGSTSYQTPNLDRMADLGVTFEHCYSTPLCTPSRVQIMSGKYNYRNYHDFGYMHPEEVTFGHLLREVGYATAIAGKWQLNGLNGHERRHDNTRPYDAGFDTYCLWQLTRPAGEGERYWAPLYEQDGEVIDRRDEPNTYGPDIFCDFLCDFIERNRGRPFFAYYPMVLTHVPFVPNPDSASRSQSKHENFADMVAYTDKLVGRILGTLEDSGLLQNTVVMFTGDNGTHPSITSRTELRTVQGGKGTLPDAGTHVPLLAYWKGHTPEGYVCRDLVDFTDVLPTLMDIAGEALPEDFVTDGSSFLPRLRGNRGHPREWVGCHYEPRFQYFDRYRGRFVRNHRFKLYEDGRFYDVAADVLEENVIRMDPAQTPRLAFKKSQRERLQEVLDGMPPWDPKDGDR